MFAWIFKAWPTLLVAGASMPAIFSSAQGSEYQGRVLTGSYVSQEQFQEALDGWERNDALLFSGRINLEVYDLGGEDLRLVMDLRDRHDFFDKVDAQRLTLTGSNTFQVRQLALRYGRERGKLFASLGRFAIPEAGRTYSDGVEIGRRFSNRTRLGAYAGLNPNRLDRAYLEFFNTQSYLAGAFLAIEPQFASFEQQLLLTNSVTLLRYASEIDRAYWFHQDVYQWNKDNRLYTLMYLDFVPRVHVQTGYLSYFHAWNSKWSTTLSANQVNAIDYLRIKDVRERLPASVYWQAALEQRYQALQHLQLKLNASYGERVRDGEQRYEVLLGPQWTNFFSASASFYSYCGYRHQFTVEQQLCRLGVGLVRESWDLTLDAEVARETTAKKKDDYPLLVNSATSHYFGSSLFASLAGEYARNAKVQIVSGYLLMGFRFGSTARKGILPHSLNSPPGGMP